MTSPAEVLRRRLAVKPIVTAVGVYDALTALMAEQAGFGAVFLSGSAMSYTQLAQPDIGLMTHSEIAAVLDRIRDRVQVPIIVDADTGFGNAANVTRSIRQLERAGAAAIQIEDQLVFKSPAALTARPLVSPAEMVGKIKAALDARENSATMISARTDAALSLGVDDALRRAALYADAGADMIFVEGLSAEADIQRLVRELGSRVPLLYNALDGGKVVPRTAMQLDDLGYSIVLFPGAIVQAVTYVLAKVLPQVAADGGTMNVKAHLDGAPGVNAKIDTPAFLERMAGYDASRNDAQDSGPSEGKR